MTLTAGTKVVRYQEEMKKKKRKRPKSKVKRRNTIELGASDEVIVCTLLSLFLHLMTFILSVTGKGSSPQTALTISEKLQTIPCKFNYGTNNHKDNP